MRTFKIQWQEKHHPASSKGYPWKDIPGEEWSLEEHAHLRMKAYWETSFSGANVGNVAVLTGTMSLFKQYLGATFVSAALAELIAFDYAPSAGDRTNIDSYYTSKFGPGLL